MAHASADIGVDNYPVSLLAGHHSLVADESVAVGGSDRGPSPHELVCAALAACTAITLRMYAQRKDWSLLAVHVEVALQLNQESRVFTRHVRLAGELDDTQRARLADITERTPVTLTLKQGATVTTIFE